MRWTKREVKACTSAIDSFWLFNKPIPPAFGYHPNTWREFVARFERALSEHRAVIVTSGIKSLRDLHAERATKDRDTAAHFRTNPQIYADSTPEMVERFERLATEEDSAVRWADALLEKIGRHGLPRAVEDYAGPQARGA